jgi:hypothetical protein
MWSPQAACQDDCRRVGGHDVPLKLGLINVNASPSATGCHLVKLAEPGAQSVKPLLKGRIFSHARLVRGWAPVAQRSDATQIQYQSRVIDRGRDE